MSASMMQFGLMLKAYDMMSSVVNSAANKSIADIGRMQAKMKAVSETASHFGRQSMANGLMVGAAVATPLKAYAEMEDASIRLKTSMMDATGKVLPQFNAVNKLAIDLGNKYPGSINQFQDMMTTLVQQGVSAEAVLGGVGLAAANLGVALKVPFETAALSAARLGDAAGVGEKDMMKFMDQIARTNNLGVGLTEMEYAFSRSGGKLKEMGLQGLSASRDLSVLYAGLIKSFGSGETVGTGFASIMSGVQSFSYGLTKPARDAKSELAGMGIHLDFLNKQGKIISLENTIKQLEKFKRLAPDKRAGILRDMFGTGQDAQMVAYIIDKGVAGYNELSKKMENQADLPTKVGEQLKSLTNIWESLSSTVVSTVGTMAGPLAEMLKPYMDSINAFVGGPLAGWVEEHKKLMGIIGVSAVGFALAATAIGALGIAAGAVGSGLSFMLSIFTGGAAVLRFFAGILMPLGRVLMAVLVPSLHMAGQAVLFLGRALLMTPVGWITMGIAAIAVGAYLIWKNWATLGPKFKGLWEWVKSMFNEWIALLASLPKKFFDAGVNMMQGLMNGIQAKAGQVMAGIKEIGSNIASSFKGVLGIHSPSRVFMGFGENISLGAALGITGAQHKAVGAARGMAAAMLIGATAPAFASPAYGPVSMPSQSSSLGTGGAASGAPVTLSVTINVNGGDAGIRDQVKQGLSLSIHEFERMLERVESNRTRRRL